jgi:hypothetical protein
LNLENDEIKDREEAMLVYDSSMLKNTKTYFVNALPVAEESI